MGVWGYSLHSSCFQQECQGVPCLQERFGLYTFLVNKLMGQVFYLFILKTCNPKSIFQVQKQLPLLKAIIQYGEEIKEKRPNLYSVSTTLFCAPYPALVTCKKKRQGLETGGGGGGVPAPPI